MIKIRVPATSANLGVGFDCLGIALNLYTYFSFEFSDSLIIEGCDEVFQNENNLVFTSYLKTLDFLQKENRNIKIVIDSHVPVSRGLGSSATCVVAGVYAAYLLTKTVINMDDILRICTQIEHHPDNVAPALFGGLRASCVVDSKVLSYDYKIHENFKFLALIPNFETSTKDARNVLPKSVPFFDAVSNLSMLAIVLKCFEFYDVENLKLVLKDLLHEPFRYELIHEALEVRNICESIDSCGFFISGSGSTLMNLISESKSQDLINKDLESLSYNWQTFVLDVDYDGVCILEN